MKLASTARWGRFNAGLARIVDEWLAGAKDGLEGGVVYRALSSGTAVDRRDAVRIRDGPGRLRPQDWMQAERRKLSRHSPVAKAMDYMLRRWELFARFLDDGRICLTNNAAERALGGIALGRKSWLFCGSDRGGVRAAAMYTLISTAKLNDVDPQAWLADVLGRIAETPQTRLDELSGRPPVEYGNR